MAVNIALDFRNERQQRSYNDIIDIYSGDIDMSAANDGFIKGVGVATLLYRGVPAKLDPNDNATAPAAFGRTFTVNLLANDVLYVCADQVLDDAMFFKLRTPGHPQENLFWAIQCDPQTYPDRGERTANYTRCRCTRCSDPTQVPADGDV